MTLTPLQRGHLRRLLFPVLALVTTVAWWWSDIGALRFMAIAWIINAALSEASHALRDECDRLDAEMEQERRVFAERFGREYAITVNGERWVPWSWKQEQGQGDPT